MLTDADRILDLERQLEEQKAVADTSRKMWAVSKILYSQRNVALAEKQRQLQIDRSAMQVRMHIPLQRHAAPAHRLDMSRGRDSPKLNYNNNILKLSQLNYNNTILHCPAAVTTTGGERQDDRGGGEALGGVQAECNPGRGPQLEGEDEGARAGEAAAVHI